MSDDVVDAGNTQIVSKPLVYDDTMSTSSIQRILFVSSGASSLETYANATTFTIVYDYSSSLEDILEVMRRKFSGESKLSRIGFAFHNHGDSTEFCNRETWFSDSDVDEKQPAVFSRNVQFIFDLLREFKQVTHVDFLACKTLQSEKWRKYYQLVQAQTGVVIGASDDDTGNVKYGGDWVLESTMEDIREVYFTGEIENYASLLYIVLTNGNIKSAINLWVTNQASALATYGDIKFWDVSGVTVLGVPETDYGSFFPAAFNADISRWNVSNVTTFRGAFNNCDNFNADISNWNVSNVTSMYRMFYSYYGAYGSVTSAFNANISRWDVSRVQDMGVMFFGARSFNQNISGWNVSSVTNMDYMFFNAGSSFNQDLSPWNVTRNPTRDNISTGATSIIALPQWTSWPSDKASMVSIILSNGSISPAFHANTTNYTFTNVTFPFTLTPYAIHGCTVTVNGAAVASRSASNPLSTSANKTVIVTSRNGAITKTYTFAHPPSPSITIKPIAANAITYPSPLSTLVLTGGSAFFGVTPVLGRYIVSNEISNNILNAGNYTDVSATFLPDTNTYSSAFTFVQSVRVLPATPGITETPTGKVVYPNKLRNVDFSGGQCFDVVGGSRLSGTFTIHPDLSNSVFDPSPYTYDVSAVFTPTSSNYGPVVTKVPLTVQKGTPVISVQPEATVVYPKTLAEAIFSGGVSFDMSGGTTLLGGTYSIHPDFSNSVIEFGQSFSDISAVYTPPDLTKFNTVTTKLRTSTVYKGTPFISVRPTATVTYPNKLGSVVVNNDGVCLDRDGGSITITGAFTIHPDLSNSLFTVKAEPYLDVSAIFTPSLTFANYGPVLTTIQTLTVSKGTPYISVKPPTATIVYPKKWSQLDISGGNALDMIDGSPLDGTFTVHPDLSNSLRDTGSYSDISAVFTPSSNNFGPVATKIQTVTVSPGTPYISVKPNASVLFPNKLNTVSFKDGLVLDMSGGSSLAGAFSIHPDLSNSLKAVGTYQDVSAIFTPTPSLISENFNPVTATTIQTLTVTAINLSQLKSLGLAVSYLKSIGYSATDLNKAGYDAKDLKTAGYPLLDIKNAGYDATALKAAEYQATDLKTVNYDAGFLKSAYSAKELKPALYKATELKAANFSLAQIKDAGYDASALYAAQYQANDLKKANYEAGFLKSAYSATELKQGSYTAKELRAADYPLLDLKTARYEVTDLKTANYLATELLNSELYVLSDLKSADYEGELKTAGYSPFDLISADFSTDKLYQIYETKAVTKAYVSYLLPAAQGKIVNVALNQLRGYSFTPSVKYGVAVKVTNPDIPITVSRSEMANGSAAIYAILDVPLCFMVFPTWSSSVQVKNIGNDTYNIYDSEGTPLHENLVSGDSITEDGLTIVIGSVTATLAPIDTGPITPVRNPFFINSYTNGGAFSMNRTLYTKTLQSVVDREGEANKQFYGKKNRDASSVIHRRKMLNLGRTQNTTTHAVEKVEPNDVRQAKQRVRNSGYVVPPSTNNVL